MAQEVDLKEDDRDEDDRDEDDHDIHDEIVTDWNNYKRDSRKLTARFILKYLNLTKEEKEAGKGKELAEKFGKDIAQHTVICLDLMLAMLEEFIEEEQNFIDFFERADDASSNRND